MERIKHSLFSLPKFGRSTLDGLHQFHELLGSPGSKFKSVHVTGTNGKGTIWHKIANIMQLAGYKTGLFISPHLIKFNERISINKELISDEDLFRIEQDVLSVYSQHRQDFKLVIFDVITMIALKYFEEKQVDYAILEVGMGGRLDSTNIIIPELSIITSVGLDHTELLGDTIEKISEEKSGIFKPGVPILIGADWPQDHMQNYLETQLEADSSLINMISREDVENEMMTNSPEITSDVNQEYQFSNFENENRAILKKAIQLLGIEQADSLQSEIEKVLSSSIQGRLQKLADNLYFDWAHNPAGLNKSLHTLFSKLPQDDITKLIVLCGFTRKDGVYKNLNTILHHPKNNHIESVILVESGEPDPRIMHYQPECLKIPTILKASQKVNDSRIKVYVPKLTSDGTPTDNSEIIGVTDIDEEDGPESTQISGDLNAVLKYLKQAEGSENTLYLVTGSFRLYRELMKSNKKLN